QAIAQRNAARQAAQQAAAEHAAQQSAARYAAAPHLATAQAAAQEADEQYDEAAESYTPAPSYDELAAAEDRLPGYGRELDDGAWISEAAREAVAEHVAAPRAPVLSAAPSQAATPTRRAAAKSTIAVVANDELAHDELAYDEAERGEAIADADS